MVDYEHYATPETFSRYLAHVLRTRCDGGIHGRVCFEPCVGDGAIVRGFMGVPHEGVPSRWETSDLDPRWCNTPRDATHSLTYSDRYHPSGIDWTITNTPFSAAIEIAHLALLLSHDGVALYLRGSIHEVLKEGPRRRWFREHPPTGIVWLPRFAHQRSRAKGKWATDSMTSCWTIWHKGARGQFIDYAPESLLDELDAETPIYRAHMDQLNGLTGSEKDREAQWIARWATTTPEAA